MRAQLAAITAERDALQRRVDASRRGRPSCGPLKKFDIELIGFVCTRSEELGSGFELYTEEVAQLDRDARAKLWDALSPIVDLTNEAPANWPPDPERVKENLRMVVAELGCSPALADAFLLSKTEYLDRYVQGGSGAIAAVQAADTNARFERIRRENPDVHAAVTELIRSVASALGAL